MITRMKGIIVSLSFLLLTAAVAGASHVSAVARQAPDASVAAASSDAATPSQTRVEASSAAPASTAVPATRPAEDGMASRAPVSVPTSASSAAPTAAEHSGQRNVWHDPDVDALERELRDLRLRARMAQRARESSRPEPAVAPQASDPIGLASTPESVPSVVPAPVAAPQPPTPVPMLASPSDVGQGRWIDVDLTRQLLTAYEGNSPVRSVAVSTGLPGTPTPAGQFRIWVKFRYDDMEGPGYYLRDVPYTMYFHGGYGLHGTYWHSNFGYPMSHGCVNLPTPEAEWLFHWADVGTLVNVHS